VIFDKYEFAGRIFKRKVAFLTLKKEKIQAGLSAYKRETKGSFLMGNNR